MVIKYIIDAYDSDFGRTNRVQIILIATGEEKAIGKAKEMVTRETYIVIEAEEIRS